MRETFTAEAGVPDILYLPAKDLAAYATSKAAVLTASDCLRAELAGSGIRVSVICPGSVHTNITRTATFSGRSGNELDAKRDHATRLVARRGYPPAKVARQIVAPGRRQVQPRLNPGSAEAERGVPVPAHKPRGGRLRGCAAAQSYQFTLVAAVVEYPRVH